jgi:hypothetical protein
MRVCLTMPLCAPLATLTLQNSNEMPLKKLRKQVEVEVQRVFSLKKLSESKRASILANMLTSLLDMDIVLKCVRFSCGVVGWIAMLSNLVQCIYIYVCVCMCW